MKKRSKLLAVILIFGYSFLYIPLILVIIYSFNSSRIVNIWGGFSLKWYKAFFENTSMISAVLNSLKIASTAATISSIIGTMAAIVFYKLKEKRRFIKFFMAPLIMPDVVLGFALLLLFVNIERIFFISMNGVFEVIIAHVTLSVSYVISVVYSRLTDIDPLLEEAAMDLGATQMKAFFLIILPIIIPSIGIGWILSFMLSIDDLVLASFVSGPGIITLPMLVFSSIRFGVSPEINVLTTIFMFVLSIFTILISKILSKKNIIR